MKATYNLEGDGVLAVICYEEILKIRAALSTGHYPTIDAFCRSLFPGNSALQQQWQQYGLSCILPGMQYFQSKFGTDSCHPVATFKAARLLSPVKDHDIQPTASDIDTLSAIAFLTDDIPQLKEELPSYLAKAADVDPSTDVLDWWK